MHAEDINIQVILCSLPTTQDGNKLSDKAIDALIVFSWYRCEDAKPRHLSYELQVSLAILLYVTGTSSRPLLRHNEIVRQPVGSMAQNLTSILKYIK